jgi:hypothetical protein
VTRDEALRVLRRMVAEWNATLSADVARTWCDFLTRIDDPEVALATVAKLVRALKWFPSKQEFTDALGGELAARHRDVPEILPPRPEFEVMTEMFRRMHARVAQAKGAASAPRKGEEAK